jgi:hypothetical protein
VIYRFAMFVREDGRVGYFSPEAHQGVILDEAQDRSIFVEMAKNYPEIMPERFLNGLGVAFGSMSKTAWEKLVSLCRLAGGEVV